jgi:hypothetical protein
MEVIDNVISILLSEGCTYNKYFLGRYAFFNLDNFNLDEEFNESELGDDSEEKLREGIKFLKKNYSRLGTTSIDLDFKFFNKGDGDIYLSLQKWPNYNSIGIGFEAIHLSDELGEKRFERLLHVIKRTYSLAQYIYGYYEDESYAAKGSLVQYPKAEDFLNYKIKNITPVNLFSNKMVEKFGRNKLLSLDVHKIEEYENGDILLTICPNPLYCTNKIPRIERQLGLR